MIDFFSLLLLIKETHLLELTIVELYSGFNNKGSLKIDFGRFDKMVKLDVEKKELKIIITIKKHAVKLIKLIFLFNKLIKRFNETKRIKNEQWGIQG